MISPPIHLLTMLSLHQSHSVFLKIHFSQYLQGHRFSVVYCRIVEGVQIYNSLIIIALQQQLLIIHIIYHNSDKNIQGWQSRIRMSGK
jgi:hypothetical protein